ncbi:hypothetical protein ACHAO9_001964 [Fusarium lateritium]
MLFDYYCCTEQGNVDITSTVRCANLPMHVQASVHDVASTFKRLLSVIPGGILGSLSLFDAFVAIHSQLEGDPEFPRTKHTKVRARLIALAIATVESQFRRELICAVFGLLSLIGRVAEITPREDDEGRSLPTADLMGYNALGIVFGPLLLGDLLGLYSMKLATPKSGLLVLPLRSPRSRQGRNVRKTLENELPTPPTVDKVLIANSITEMLIVNWRDVVRQMKSLGMNRRAEPRSVSPQTDSQDNDFVIKKPQGWDREWRASERGYEIKRESSPEPPTPTLGISKQRSRRCGSSTSKKLAIRPSVGFLSPTVEENTPDEDDVHDTQSQSIPSGAKRTSGQMQEYKALNESNIMARSEDIADSPKTNRLHDESIDYIAPTPIPTTKARAIYGDSPRVSEDDVPPRTSSKQGSKIAPLQQVGVDEPTNQTSKISTSRDVTPIERKGAIRKKHPGKEKPQKTPRQSIAAEWSELLGRSSGMSMDKSESQPTHLEFYSEKEALEAALKAHFEELKELEYSDQHKMVPPETNAREESGTSILADPIEIPQQPLNKTGRDSEYRDVENGTKTTATQQFLAANSASSTPRQFYAPMQVPQTIGDNTLTELHSPQSHRVSPGTLGGLPSTEGLCFGRSQDEKPGFVDDSRGLQQHVNEMSDRLRSSRVMSLPAETPKTDHRLYEASAPWSSIPRRKPKASKRPSLSPANNEGGVRAMAAKFETSNHSTETSPAQPRSASKTQNLISQFSQGSPTKSVRSTRSVSTLGHNRRNGSISSQNPLHSRNASTGVNALNDEAHVRDLRISIGEEAAMRAAELQHGNKGQKQAQASYDQAEMLAQRQVVPPRKPIPGKIQEASLENPRSLGTMMPYPEQPPIAQHLNLIRPSSSTSNVQYGADSLQIPHGTAAPIPRPGSTTTLHTQIRNLQRQLDLKTEETVQLKRQLEVQEDADVGTLSQQLREAKREAHMWRERAESAERRIKVFERFTSRLNGIREASALSKDAVDPGDKLTDPEYFGQDAEKKEQKENVFGDDAAGYESDSSGRTEDAGLVTARIRRCLHGLTDGPPDKPQFGIDQYQNTVVSEKPEPSISPSAVEAWMAAQGLLQLGEAQGQNNTSGAFESDV